MPKVSIIISVYNGEKYIKESINSVLSQTFTDFELIIVNDGSTDNTRSVISSASDKRITLIDNEYNEGIFVSRNRAILRANGEYIAILDGDDVCMPDRIARQYNTLNTNKDIGFLGSHAIKIGPHGQLMGYMSYPPKTTQEARRCISQLNLNPIIDPTSMFRKDIFISHGGYSLHLPHSMDYELWCRLLNHNVKMTNIQTPLLKYRVHDKSISTNKHDEMQEAALNIRAAFMLKKLEDPVLRVEFYNNL